MEAQKVKGAISAYLYTFGAWLTTREEQSGPFSSANEASQMAELLGEFIEKYQLGNPNFTVVPPDWVLKEKGIDMRVDIIPDEEFGED